MVCVLEVYDLWSPLASCHYVASLLHFLNSEALYENTYADKILKVQPFSSFTSPKKREFAHS